MVKPYSEACDQNKVPILAVLRETFAHTRKVLEIGSGTGQHAVFFGRHLQHLAWQTSDLPEQHAGIRAWLKEAESDNVLPPLALDVRQQQWPVERTDAVFSANCVHIMSWEAVGQMFAGVGRVLETRGLLCLYGPFNYNGKYTSESNRRFDAWLKSRDPDSGIRDFDALDGLAGAQGMELLSDYAMPANNRTIVWWRNGGAQA